MNESKEWTHEDRIESHATRTSVAEYNNSPYLLVNTFTEGPYAYGQNNEQEARIAERLAAFNHSFIQANNNVATPFEAIFEAEEGLLHDGTIVAMKLSLPIMGEKVPCPKCGVLLKDEKSIGYVAISSLLSQ